VTGTPAPQRQIRKLVKQTLQTKRPLIAVVGPCASGKSLLVHALRELGHDAREVAQEHSYVPAMWQHITQPDLLIYLDVSWVVACQRRPTDARSDWWAEQARRLHHARQHADLYIQTDELTPQEVLEATLAFLKSPPLRRGSAGSPCPDVAGLGC
jgi:hypothetical protein